MHAASTYPKPFPNSVNLETGSGAIPGPSIITYKIFKAALLAIVEAWEPVRCGAFPYPILDHADKGAYFREQWIQYLCPWLAEHIKPPQWLRSARSPGKIGRKPKAPG